MADQAQAVIASPDFDTIAAKAGTATRDAVYLLWSVLNLEISQRRSGDQQLTTFWSLAASNSAPAADQHNFNVPNASIHYFTGADAFNLTGLRNGKEGAIRIIHNTGAGTVTVKNSSGSSDATNRIVTSSGADKSLTTNLTIVLIYLNARWREWKPV